MGVYTGTVPTFLTGELPDADKFAEITNFMTAATSEPSSFTPTWTSSGTQPAIGNGVLAGAYTRLGKFVFFRISMTAGSGTTFGTGSWAFALPAAINIPVNLDFGWGGTILDSGTALYPMWAIPGASNTADVRYSNAGVLSGVTGTAPMTWTTSDRILFSGYYWST